MKKPNNYKISKHTLEKEIRHLIDTFSESGNMPSVPNKRKKGKQFIGGYVSNVLKREFKKVARKEAGGDAKQMLVKLVVEGLQRRGIDVTDGESK